MKIYFDMDGVLADFQRGVRELAHIEPKAQELTHGKNVEMWEELKKVDHFYGRLEPIPGSVELFLKVFKKHGQDCQILTGVPRSSREILYAAEDKTDWVHRVISPEVTVNICYRENKKEYASGKASYLIDDFSRTIEEWEKCGGTGIYFKDVAQTEKELIRLGLLEKEL